MIKKHILIIEIFTIKKEKELLNLLMNNMLKWDGTVGWVHLMEECIQEDILDIT